MLKKKFVKNFKVPFTTLQILDKKLAMEWRFQEKKYLAQTLVWTILTFITQLEEGGIKMKNWTNVDLIISTHSLAPAPESSLIIIING